MEFNEFREKVKEALPDFLTDDLKNAEIKDTAVNKLQGESYSGISVTPEGSRVGVSINLEDAFLDYQTGSQFTAVMNRLADTLVGTLGEREQFDLGFLTDYSAVKEMLTVEVVGKDQNAEMLQSVPHQEMEDLAAVYRIDLGETENGNATVLITNEMMRNYGITPDQLHQDALDAAQHTMKYSIQELREITAYDELELDTLGEQKTALFLIMSDTDSTFNFLISMIYTQLFNLLCEKADDVYGGRLPIHVR